MNNNVFCIGELLIDMVCVDNKGLKNGEKFEKKAGGAPANVAASICKLEGNAYFLGQVGNDFFGKHLVELLKSLNIKLKNLNLEEKQQNVVVMEVLFILLIRNLARK